MKGVLITGGTGNVGARLAAEYLERGGYRVFLVVRAISEDAARQRAEETLRFWDVDPAVVSEHLVVYRGDVCEENLGLTAAALSDVQEHVQLLVHADANIRLDLGLDEARKMVVGGTVHALAVAKGCARLERFGFVSTMEVMGDYTGVAHEEFLTHYVRGFLNTYEVTKAEAEEFLKIELEQSGVPVTVFRLGMVVGEAKTGRALGFQSFYLMIERMLLNPVSPVLPSGCPVDIIPVDVLAEAMLALMEHPEAESQVYHLSGGMDDRAAFREFVGKVQPLLEAELGHKIWRPLYISPHVYHLALKVLGAVTVGRIRRNIDIQRIFIKFMSLEWRFETVKTKKTLASLGVEMPSFDTVLPKLVRFYIAHREKTTFPL